MSKIEDGGPAFPCEGYTGRDGENRPYAGISGMTLRDYFAAKAMAAFVQNDGVDWVPADYAKSAYEMADFMLKARQQ